VDLYSNEKQIDAQTPRAIILLADDDRAVPSPNGVNYYLAMKKKGIPATLHVYPKGGHGFGFKDTFKYHDAMLKNLTDWLKSF
jgi:acetyl esterase/lipase